MRRVSLVLASASPRRRDLLESAGIACVIDPVNVDETQVAGEAPVPYAERVARLKAEAGAARHPGAIVIGADTIVVPAEGGLLGKPRDVEDAARMLKALAGRAHDVITAVALARGGDVTVRVDRTVVWMRPLAPAEIAAYVESGEPMDKAGAYAIQGLASRFITRIDGSYTNVVGLPVALLVEMLGEIGAVPPLFP